MAKTTHAGLVPPPHKPDRGSSKASSSPPHGLSEEELSQWVTDQIHREIAEAMGRKSRK